MEMQADHSGLLHMFNILASDGVGLESKTKYCCICKLRRYRETGQDTWLHPFGKSLKLLDNRRLSISVYRMAGIMILKLH